MNGEAVVEAILIRGNAQLVAGNVRRPLEDAVVEDVVIELGGIDRGPRPVDQTEPEAGKAAEKLGFSLNCTLTGDLRFTSTQMARANGVGRADRRNRRFGDKLA
ncbi:hypothetical protein TYRP_011677 [Tyrophagus putrescentiae]|nr:hypothetical protein TYRP_011677 [Tyrophagus putrescentiae]